MTAPGVDAGPYDLAPRGSVSGDAALCIHGLTGTPYEVRPLAEALADRGLRARGPLLAGHGESPEELARVTYVDWLDCVRAEFVRLSGEHERVFVCGLSLGGLLTLWLAANEPVAAAAASPVEGNVEQIGWLLYTDYLIPFEVASVLLLVAMVGAIVLAKREL